MLVTDGQVSQEAAVSQICSQICPERGKSEEKNKYRVLTYIGGL